MSEGLKSTTLGQEANFRAIAWSPCSSHGSVLAQRSGMGEQRGQSEKGLWSTVVRDLEPSGGGADGGGVRWGGPWDR